MAKQLVFTSVPSGLRPGTRGFCTVAASKDMPPPLVSKLESLSGYTHSFNPSGSDAKRNPVVWSYQRLKVGNTTYRVLSRRSTAGADYTGRSNTIAHHLVLDPAETASGSAPGVLRGARTTFLERWDGPPKHLDPVAIHAPADPPTVCREWEAAFGDAGYAGLLLRCCHESPRLPAYVVYPEGADPLDMMAQAISIAPASMDGWANTFTTHYTGNTAGAECMIRFVMAGTPAANEIPKLGNAVVIASAQLPALTDDEWVAAARHGASIQPSAPKLPPSSLTGGLPPLPSRKTPRPGKRTENILQEAYELHESDRDTGPLMPPMPPSMRLEPQRRVSPAVIGGGIAAGIIILGLIGVIVMMSIRGGADKKPGTVVARTDAGSAVEPTGGAKSPEEADAATPTKPVEPEAEADLKDETEAKTKSETETETETKPKAEADPDPEPEPKSDPKPQHEPKPEPAWVAVSGEDFILGPKHPTKPDVPDKTRPIAIPSQGGFEMPWSQDRVTLIYQGLPDGVTFEKLEKGETPRFVIKDATREIAEIHLKTNPPAEEKLMLSATALVGDKELIQILGGTSLAFQSAGVTRIFYIEDTVQQLEVDPIPFPPASTGEEKVATLSLSARQPVVGLVIDDGSIKFVVHVESPLSAKLSHDEKALSIIFKPVGGKGAASQELDLCMTSSLSNEFAGYMEARSKKMTRDAVLQILREYKPVFEKYRNVLTEANKLKDFKKAERKQEEALEEMLSAQSKIDKRMAATEYSERGDDFLSNKKITDRKTKSVEEAIQSLEKEIEKYNIKVTNANKDLLAREKRYTKLVMKPSLSGHEIELKSGLGVPVAKFKLEFDIRELPAPEPD